MIEWGYHLYKDSEGKLRFDQIVDGARYALVPIEADHDRPLGWYDYEMKPVKPGADDDTSGSDPKPAASAAGEPR